MEYRVLGNTGVKISSLGYGAMRLPIINGEFSNVDENESTRLIRYAIDSGVNYIDTAYPYHAGSSEKAVGKALKDGYRNKVILGSKIPLWLCEKYEDYEKYLEEQLNRLDVECLDLYMLHSIFGKNFQKAIDQGIFKFLEKAKKDGKIKHIGFSFHDSFEMFKKVVDSYPWDFCLIQLNFMDDEYQAGIKGLKYAAKKGLGVLIMEPLKGGLLAKEAPESIAKIWEKSEFKMTTAQRALSWLYNFPQVSCVLSGMTTEETVKENIVTFSNAKPNSLSEQELEIYKEIKEEYKRLTKVGCTGCQYCMPCPLGVDIPSNIDYYNMAYMYDSFEFAKNFYNRPLYTHRKASHCVSCKECLDKCPQHINIPKVLETIVKEFEG